MDNSLFIKNILILIFCVILIHIFLNDFLADKNCNNKANENFQDTEDKENLQDLQHIEDIQDFQNNKTIVYLFYADWCGHCQDYKPIYYDFKNKVNKDDSIKFREINADDDINDKEELYKKYQINGFPTTVIQKNDSFQKLVGKQTLETLLNGIRPLESFGQVDFNGENPDFTGGDKTFTNNNSDIFYKNDNNDTIVYNFNTTWCDHSKQFEPEWNKFAKEIENYENIKAINVKCDLDENINFCKKFEITSVPAIIIVRNNELVPYKGTRNVQGLLNALKININDKELDDKVKINNQNDNGMHFMEFENNNIKTTVYNFNTEWCRYSRDFQPEWNQFVNSLNNSDGVKAIDVKCDNNQNKDLCKKYDIPGYPSVVIKSGNRIEIYDGPRTAQGLRKHLKL